MLLLRDNSLRAWRSPVDILSFGLSNSTLASSNFTSSRKVSRATDGWTGGSQSDSRGKDEVRFLPREQSGISLNLRTGPIGHAPLFNQ